MINETSLEACDSCLLSEELLFHLHSFTPSKSLSEQGTDDCRQPGTELAGLERGEVWLPCPVWSIAIELFILHAVYLRSNWDNWEYAEIELHSYEVLCSLEMTLACPKAPLPYFPSSVLLLAQVVWRVLPDLGQGQEPSALFKAPEWTVAWSEPLAMNPCSSAFPLPFLTVVFVPFHTVIIFCFCCLFFRVSVRRCAAWASELHCERSSANGLSASV